MDRLAHQSACSGLQWPPEKLTKLVTACIAVLENRSTTVKALQSLLGLLHWLLHVAPILKPWLSCLYDDLARPLGTSFSLNPGHWQSLANALDDSLYFVSSPAGSGIPVGGKLLSAKHVELRRRSDLKLVQPSGKRVWLRIADPRTEKRKLSDTSREFVKFWMRWAICSPRLRALRPIPSATPVLVAADAMASGNKVGIGGFAMLHADSPLVWFSESFEVQDFQALGLQMQPQAQRDITSYEILAQHALLMLVTTLLPAGRLALHLPTLSDNTNTGSESSVNKLFSTVYPVCMFLQRIASLSALSGIILEVAHVPGVANDDADMLSRWDGTNPTCFEVADAVSYSPVFGALVVFQDGCQGVAGEQPLALATACILRQRQRLSCAVGISSLQRLQTASQQSVATLRKAYRAVPLAVRGRWLPPSLTVRGCRLPPLVRAVCKMGKKKRNLAR